MSYVDIINAYYMSNFPIVCQLTFRVNEVFPATSFIVCLTVQVSMFKRYNIE